MIHYIIVKLIDKANIDKYISLAKPIYEEMIRSIEGLKSCEIIVNKIDGKNNYDVMAKLYFDSMESLEKNYKPNDLHKKLKEETEFLVEKKTIFDE